MYAHGRAQLAGGSSEVGVKIHESYKALRSFPSQETFDKQMPGSEFMVSKLALQTLAFWFSKLSLQTFEKLRF